MPASQDEPPPVEVRRLATGYDPRQPVLEDVGFQVAKGEVFGVLGDSGSGKSTLLKNMIGLLPPFSGDVHLLGRDLWGSRTRERRGLLRRIGVMYQRGALFESMSLLDNVMLPLEETVRLPKEARRRLASYKLSLVGLGSYLDHRPAEISGGMRKRAAIARALALDPEVLFLDEPGSGLDPITSREVDELVLQLSEVLRLTFVIVTHDLDSIFRVIDRAVILEKAARSVVAEGRPAELARSSEHPFVRRFLAHGGEAGRPVRALDAGSREHES